MGEQTIQDLIYAGVVELGDGYRTKRSEHGFPGYRIVRVADIQSSKVHLDGDDFVSEDFARQMGSKIATAGDVLLTTKGTVGRVAVMPETTERAVYSPQVCYFRCRRDEILSADYLRYWLQSPEFLEQSAFLQGNTDMAPYISLTDLRTATISLPRPDEQRAIAEVLGALDDKIAANTKFAATVEELLQTEFAALGLDVEPEDPDRTVLTSELFELNPAGRRVRDDEPIYVDMARLPTDRFAISDWVRRPASGGVRFMTGDTVMARITPCLENGKVGYIDFLDPGEVGIGSTEYIVVRSRQERGVPLELSYFLVRSPRFQANAVQHMVGSSGRQRVAARDLEGFPLSRPLDEAVAAFGAAATPLFRHVRSLISENRHLAQTRDALLPALMSGRLRVRDAERLVDDPGAAVDLLAGGGEE